MILFYSTSCQSFSIINLQRYGIRSLCVEALLISQMLSRAVTRATAAPARIARRGFHSAPLRLSSPYHYPTGPRSNLPFNPLTRFFGLRYWGTMGRLASSTIPPELFLSFKQRFSSLCRSASQVGLSLRWGRSGSNNITVWQTKKNK